MNDLNTFKSESIKDLAAALSKAQAKIQKASKDKQNPFFKSNYADLGNIVDVIKEPLAENDLSYIQMNDDKKDDGVSVSTVIMHSSGQWINCGPVSFPASKKDPQGYGSAITYARRYSLAAAFGVATEDDDGNGASKRDNSSQQKKEYTKNPPQATPKNNGEAKMPLATPDQIKQFKSLAIELKISEESVIEGFMKKGYKAYEEVPASIMDSYINDFLKRLAKKLEEKMINANNDT